MGRPPIPKSQRKSVRLSFRLTPKLYRQASAAAGREGKWLSEFIHDLVAEAVKGGA